MKSIYIIAENSVAYVLKKNGQYTRIKKTDGITDNTRWHKTDTILHSSLHKGGFNEVNPPKKYGKDLEKSRKSIDRVDGGKTRSKKDKLSISVEQLGLENFEKDLVTNRVVRKSSQNSLEPDLMIFLEKSRHGLVLRKVPVTLPSGKQVFANRWVQPNKKDGESKVSTSKQENTTESNKNSISPFSEDITKIDSVPIAEENVDGSWKGMDGNTYNSEMDALIGQYIGPEIYQSNSTKKWHIDGSDESFGTEKQAYRKAYELVREKAKTSKPKTSQEISRRPVSQTLVEEVSDIVKEYMKTQDTSGDNIYLWADFEKIAEMIPKEDIIKSAKDLIPSNLGEITELKNRMLKRTLIDEPSAFSIIGSDPAVLKTVLQETLGEEVYSTFVDQFSDSTIAINLDLQVMVENVMKEGSYNSYTPEQKLDIYGKEAVSRYKAGVSNLKSEDLLDEDKIYERITENYPDSVLNDETPGNNEMHEVKYLSRRIMYEHKHFCLNPGDVKPVYAAYNLANHEQGGAPGYGSGWLELEPSVLNKCTVTSGDSFGLGKLVSHVSSMDHLHDLAILKHVSYDITKEEGEDDRGELSKEKVLSGEKDSYYNTYEWNFDFVETGDMTLELQYLESSITEESIAKYHGVEYYDPEDYVDGGDDW